MWLYGSFKTEASQNMLFSCKKCAAIETESVDFVPSAAPSRELRASNLSASVYFSTQSLCNHLFPQQVLRLKTAAVPTLMTEEWRTMAAEQDKWRRSLQVRACALRDAWSHIERNNSRDGFSESEFQTRDSPTVHLHSPFNCYSSENMTVWQWDKRTTQFSRQFARFRAKASISPWIKTLRCRNVSLVTLTHLHRISKHNWNDAEKGRKLKHHHSESFKLSNSVFITKRIMALKTRYK